MKTLLAVVLFFLLNYPHVYGQGTLTPQELSDLVHKKVEHKINKTEATGTPYIYEDFKEGSLELMSGPKTQKLMMNFNVDEERIEFINKNNSILALELSLIKSFEFYESGSPVVFKKGYKARRLSPSDFVKVLAEGEVSFLEKPEVTHIKNVATFGTAVKQEKYVKKYRYYFSKDGKTKELKKLSEKTVVSALGEKDKLTAYIKKHNLDMKSPSDIARLVDYRNTIK